MCLFNVTVSSNPDRFVVFCPTFCLVAQLFVLSTRAHKLHGGCRECRILCTLRSFLNDDILMHFERDLSWVVLSFVYPLF